MLVRAINGSGGGGGGNVSDLKLLFSQFMSVKNTGTDTGISADKAKQVFLVFQQIATYTDRYGYAYIENGVVTKVSPFYQYLDVYISGGTVWVKQGVTTQTGVFVFITGEE